MLHYATWIGCERLKHWRGGLLRLAPTAGIPAICVLREFEFALHESRRFFDYSPDE